MIRSRWVLLLCVLVCVLAACGPVPPTPTAPPRPTVSPVVVITPTAGSTPTATTAGSPTLVATGAPTTAATPASGVETGTGWSSAGSLTSGRARLTATLLPNGRVIVVGGESGSGPGQQALGHAEIYVPETNSWMTTAALSQGRRHHTATLLVNGRLLVFGGEVETAGSGKTQSTATGEVYDVGAGLWQPIKQAATSRLNHTATLLPDGRVLIVGGESGTAGGQNQALSSAEIYNPATNSWSAAGELFHARSGHTATLLPNGQVLIAGGESRPGSRETESLASAEIYDPVANQWEETGQLTTGRHGQTATLLANGRVLVVGGQTPDARGTRFAFLRFGSAALTAPSASAEVYDPTTRSWTPASSLNIERTDHTATLLPNGDVIVVGGVGRGSSSPLDSAERYDVAANRWVKFVAPTARTEHAAALLTDGSILVVGGRSGPASYLPTAERFQQRGQLPAPPTATVPATLTPVPTVPPIVVPNVSPTPVPTEVPPLSPSPSPTPSPSVSPSPSVAPSVRPSPSAAPSPSAQPSPSAKPSVPPSPSPSPSPPPSPPPPPTFTPTTVPKPGTVFGSVVYCLASCVPASGAVVSIGSASTVVNANGSYVLANVGPGPVTVTVTYKTRAGTSSDSQQTTVPSSGRVQVDFALK